MKQQEPKKDSKPDRYTTFKVFLGLIACLAFSISIQQVFFTEKHDMSINEFNLVLLLIVSIIAAFLCKYSKHLDHIIHRIEKIGPITLSPKNELKKILYLNPRSILNDPKIPGTFERKTNTMTLKKDPLTPKELDHYERICEFIRRVEISGITPEDMDMTLKEDYEKALFNAGQYSFLNGEVFKAIRMHESVTAITDDDSYENLVGLATAYFWASEYEKGDEYIKVIEKAIKLYETALDKKYSKVNYIIYYQLGWGYDELEDYPKAIGKYKHSFRFKKSHDTMYNIAASFSKWEKFEQSLRWLRKVSAETLKGIDKDTDFNPLRASDFAEDYTKLLNDKGF